MQFNLKEKLVYGLSMLLTRFTNRGKNLLDLSPATILVVKLDEIGDLCYSLHVFDLLKEKYPTAHITVYCKPFAGSLLLNHPAVHQTIHELNAIPAHIDLWVELRGNFKTILKAFFSKPTVRLDRATIRYKNKLLGGHPHEIVTNQQIVEPLFESKPAQHFPILTVGDNAQLAVQHFLKTQQIQDYVLIHPGARKALRRWKPHYFAALADWLIAEFNVKVVFIGDKSETAIIESIMVLGSNKFISAAGIGDLTFLAALMSNAKLFVGNESGPLSIASVSEIPTVGLFGPGEPNVFYPIGKKTAYVHHVLACNPCNQVKCVSPHQTCMDLITLLEVQDKIKSVIDSFN